MADAMQRIVYDATVDDAVDAGLRLLIRTQAFRRQMRRSVLLVGIIMTLAALAVSAYFAPPADYPDSFVVLLLAAAFGVLTSVLFRGFFVREIRKQHRKIVLEQFSGNPTIPSELELRRDAVWVRQAGMEMTFPWNVCTSVKNNPDDIELNFSPGICIVRNTYFASTDARQAFLETARGLANPTIPTNPS